MIFPKDIELLISGEFEYLRDFASSFHIISCRAAVDLAHTDALSLGIMLCFFSFFLFGHRHTGFVASNASVVMSKNVLYIAC